MKAKLMIPCSAWLIILICAGFKTKPRPTHPPIIVQFNFLVNNNPLKLNDSLHRYSTANGDDFYVTTFKFYISNIVFTKKSGERIPIPDSYYLVNAADSSSWNLALGDLPTGKYKSIEFVIGVDSLRNFAGAQTGTLDPARGMFWTWKSGYIFVKMEGVSSKSTSNKNRLTFHIGGAIAPDNTIREFAEGFSKTLKIGRHNQAQIDIGVDVAALFKGKTTVDFSAFSFTMGGPKSVIIADNYADGLFHIIKVSR